MAQNTLADSFCNNQKKCGTERVINKWLNFTDLLKFNENIKARNHATNVYHRISQDSSQRVTEFNAEHIHVKATVQSFVETDIRMLKNLHICNRHQMPMTSM